MIDKKTTYPDMNPLRLATVLNFGFNRQFKSIAHMMVEATKNGDADASRAKKKGATTIECAWVFNDSMKQFAEPQIRDAILQLNELCGILGLDMKEYRAWTGEELSEAGTEA